MEQPNGVRRQQRFGRDAGFEPGIEGILQACQPFVVKRRAGFPKLERVVVERPDGETEKKVIGRQRAKSLDAFEVRLGHDQDFVAGGKQLLNHLCRLFKELGQNVMCGWEHDFFTVKVLFTNCRGV